MDYHTQYNHPTSEYQIIFRLNEINEEDLLNVENQITSSGHAQLNPNSDYNQGIRTWHLDWKNHGDNPHEIIAKLKKYKPEIYRKILVERIKPQERMWKFNI
jgi:hypothetical protein